jgi:transposase
LTDAGRAARERLRFQAAERFEGGRRFHKSSTVQGFAALLKRHGWSCQMPARRAVEREEAAVVEWVKETWPSVEGPWRRSGPGSTW